VAITGLLLAISHDLPCEKRMLELLKPFFVGISTHYFASLDSANRRAPLPSDCH
jgi:hypothetical protein